MSGDYESSPYYRDSPAVDSSATALVRPDWLVQAVGVFQRLALPANVESTSTAIVVKEALTSIGETRNNLEQLVLHGLMFDLVIHRPDLGPVVLDLVQASASARDRANDWVTAARVRNYLSENFRGRLTLDTIAHALGLSRTTMCDCFRRVYAPDSIHQYLLRKRLAFAYDLLVLTDLKISAVAAEAGFTDRSAFHREFRKRFGMAPGRTRDP